MTRTLLLSATAAMALAGNAQAANIEGWYVSLEGGGNWIDDNDVSESFNGGVPTVTTFQFDSGWAGLAAVGYGMRGFRFELEGGYRANQLQSNAGDFNEWSAMANVLYDIRVTNSVRLSLGAGAGGDFANLQLVSPSLDDDDWNFAYQGIAGVSVALSKRLDLVFNYHYLRVMSPDFSGPGTVVETDGTWDIAMDDVSKHTATVGLRYAFGAEEAPPPVEAPPPPPPVAEVEVPREFIVFFGHNQSNLTSEAQEVVRQAAMAAKHFGNVTISLVGHADRSGSDKYNNALSLKRSVSVKGALVGEGVADTAISVSGKGEGDPLVPTADGVREPQNRRVHISL